NPARAKADRCLVGSVEHRVRLEECINASFPHGDTSRDNHEIDPGTTNIVAIYPNVAAEVGEAAPQPSAANTIDGKGQVGTLGGNPVAAGGIRQFDRRSRDRR